MNHTFRPRAAEFRGWWRTWWPTPFRPWLAGRQVGLCYAVAVLIVSLLIATQPPHRLRALVEQSSTNLANLSSHPFAVLFLSAFVVSPAIGLVLLVPLVIAYGEVQRWLGGLSMVLIAVFGHVGATLVVMMLEITALRRHLADLRVAVSPDVGVSYGLFCAVGVLLFEVPRHWRPAYAGGCVVLLAALLWIQFGFTNLGHLTAWLIGVSLGWLMHSRVSMLR